MTSLNENVLTDYTAILVLEPGFVIDEEELPDDNQVPVYLGQELSVDGFMLRVSPNPATESSRKVIRLLVHPISS